MSIRHCRPFARRATTPIALAVAAALSLTACGSDEPADSVDAAVDAAVDAPAPVASAAVGEASAEALGSGSVSYDGVRYDNFTGNCEISRGNGREDVGDVSTRGLVVSAAVDNTKSSPELEMSFTALNDSSFTVNTHRADGPAKRSRGVLSGMQYKSARTPRNSSQDIASVEFAGQTNDGVPVVALLVCEIQNAFK